MSEPSISRILHLGDGGCSPLQHVLPGLSCLPSLLLALFSSQTGAPSGQCPRSLPRRSAGIQVRPDISLLLVIFARNIFYPHPLFFNNHLSLIPFVFACWLRKVFPIYPYHTEHFLLSDGEFISVDWVIGDQVHPQHGLRADPNDTTPIVMIHHGICGNSRDIPGQSYIEGAVARGWIVCIFNRRGHAGPLTRPRWNLFGSTGDIREAVSSISARRPRAPLLKVGLSVGSAVVARYFGEEGNEFTAGVGVSPGYNIEVCMKRIPEPYNRLLLHSVKTLFLRRNRSILQSIPGYSRCLQANCVQELLDESFTMAGYRSKDEYYFHSNPIKVTQNVNRPLLMINAKDGKETWFVLLDCHLSIDPLCIMQNIEEHMPLFKESIHAILALSSSGSHLPFYLYPTDIFRPMECWAEQATYAFFDAVLLHSKQRQK